MKNSRTRVHFNQPETRPRILLFLASFLLLASFIDSYTISHIPYVHNIGSVVGIFLLLSFLSLRLNKAHFLAQDCRFVLMFIVLSGFIEVVRILSIGTSEVFIALREFFQYVQVVILYLIFFDLAQDPRFMRWTGIAFLTGTTIMSIAANLNIGRLTRGDEDSRFGLIGLNYNMQGLLYSLGIILIMCWVLSRFHCLKGRDLFLGVCSLSMMYALVKTGSRSAALTLAAGTLITLILFFHRKRLGAYVTIVPIILIVMTLVYQEGNVLQKRFQKTLQTGDTSLRVEIAGSGFDLFLEQPVFGYGAQYSRDLGDYMQKSRRLAAHNLYLQILLAFGMVGFFPFLIAVVRTLRTSLLNRKSPQVAIVLALFASLLFAGASGNLGHEKIFWIIFAIAGRSSAISKMMAFSLYPPPPRRI